VVPIGSGPLLSHRVRRGSRRVAPAPPLVSLYAGASPGWPGEARLEPLEDGPGEVRRAPVGALELLSGEEVPLLLCVRTPHYAWQEGVIEIGTPGTPEAIAHGEAFFEELEAEARARSVFRGRLVRPHFQEEAKLTRLEILASGGEDAPYLPPVLRERLDAVYLRFKRARGSLEARGVPTQRGLLLCGPPGTGKTSTCRLLHRELPDHTFLSVSMAALGHLEGVFAVARRLAPAVVVLDDVDLYANTREQSGVAGLLGNLMAQMDGLTPRDQVDVVMTSNYWSGIEKALALRPGRIDAVLMYEVPDAAARRALLERFLEGVEVRAPWPALVDLTEGLAPAQLREICKQALAAAACRQPPGGAFPAVSRTDLEGACALLRDNPLAPPRRSARALKRGKDRLFRLDPGGRGEDPHPGRPA